MATPEERQAARVARVAEFAMWMQLLPFIVVGLFLAACIVGVFVV